MTPIRIEPGQTVQIRLGPRPRSRWRRFLSGLVDFVTLVIAVGMAIVTAGGVIQTLRDAGTLGRALDVFVLASGMLCGLAGVLCALTARRARRELALERDDLERQRALYRAEMDAEYRELFEQPAPRA